MIATDVCIIGAGPAGAAAALQLHQYNIPCVVVDKAVFPRDKICGDGLSGKVLTALNRIDKSMGDRLCKFSAKEGSWGVTFSAAIGSTPVAVVSDGSRYSPAASSIFSYVKIRHPVLTASARASEVLESISIVSLL